MEPSLPGLAAVLNEASCQPKRLIFILKTQTYKFSYGPDSKKEKQLFHFFKSWAEPWEGTAVAPCTLKGFKQQTGSFLH